MKKQLLVAALALSIFPAFSQDLTSKKGEAYLPEAEEWGLGIDATPILQYAGNFFGKANDNAAPTFNFLNGSSQHIMGKYFTDAQTAYRVGLRIGMGSQTSRRMVDDRSDDILAPPTPSTNSYPDPSPTVENSWKRSTSNFGLSVGMEKRRGKTRLQGYYGGELGINLSSSKDVFTYGNALNTATVNTVDVDNDDSFIGANNVTSAGIGVPGMVGSARITERKNGSVFSFGLRGFIGVEYFFLPKMSMGGEFGWGLGLSSGGKTTTTYESVGDFDPLNPNSTNKVGESTIEGAKGNTFALDTDNKNSLFGPTASLRLNFHF
jgi:hypothetical protein